MKQFELKLIILAFAASIFAAPAQSADAAFTLKSALRNVKSDPSGIWSGAALDGEKISIFEYQLSHAGGNFLVSQIWNDECAPATCPTKLLRLHRDGRRTVLIEDMMRQIIPPQNMAPGAAVPRISAQNYAHHPFRLSADGKRLINGDFSFDLSGGR